VTGGRRASSAAGSTSPGPDLRMVTAFGAAGAFGTQIRMRLFPGSYIGRSEVTAG
jgi:hypothetical protein